MMKNIFKPINAAFGVFMFAASVCVQAATVTFDAMESTVAVGDTFTLTLMGNGFPTDTTGGAINLGFDSSVLNMTGISLDPLFIDIGNSSGFDNQAGVANIDFGTFNPVNAVGQIFATLTFEAVGEGISDIFTSTPNSNPLATLSGAIPAADLVFDIAKVSVVPLPAAAWLLGTALLGLIGVARRS